ncbi:carboxymuconolactone decarboxylase family protein [Levilactobacillus tujiorum]|uniref:Carboxymuconolactone decarboxylase family protein n=1 Tax=Levilactobacillus tujiorum TaxID=2912243 RepID=A0ABX1L0U6_9LACO|nr:carboxymuconolactone decarboxylase family protein [Levilactobacillus tujiorum]MCH5463659.1 carboxymuconolactone decarboxylase family protein [Levilactobacillus tujiorum]NLR10863.1 carboxymuconolactone decarboxylase family protein [Lactobacillus sp. HBUAS51387]NLR28645.1 carboxymuconolactone decarboxylase family protein [Levilactobacillus tujiorum]
MDRLEKGKNLLNQVDAAAADTVMTSLKDIAPDISQYILEFAFGDIYARPGLTLQQRELVTITALLVKGDTSNQLTVHLNGCLNVGLTPKEIIETCIHCIPYIGFPRVLNAITVAQQVFTSRHITV